MYVFSLWVPDNQREWPLTKATPLNKHSTIREKSIIQKPALLSLFFPPPAFVNITHSRRQKAHTCSSGRCQKAIWETQEIANVRRRGRGRLTENEHTNKANYSAPTTLWASGTDDRWQGERIRARIFLSDSPLQAADPHCLSARLSHFMGQWCAEIGLNLQILPGLCNTCGYIGFICINICKSPTNDYFHGWLV